MIEFKITQDGASVPSNNTEALQQFLKNNFESLGLQVYIGDPSTNGCPFDFGNFTYNPGVSSSYDPFMMTIIHPQNQDMCIVIGYLGTLTLNSFSGATSSLYIAVYSRNLDNELVYSRVHAITSAANPKFYGWALTTNTCTSYIFSGPLSLVFSADLCGIWYDTQLYLYTHNLVTVNISNVSPSNPHIIAINKPISEYGFATVVFPFTDPISYSTIFQFLLQGKTYYVINATRSVSFTGTTKFYCIY